MHMVAKPSRSSSRDADAGTVYLLTARLSAGRLGKAVVLRGGCGQNASTPGQGGTMATKSRDTIDLNLLKTIPIFSSCSRKEIGAIGRITKEVTFDPGVAICREGETGVGLHIVVEGETKVQIGGRTRRRLGPGAFFGEVAVLDGGPRTATVIAETPVRTLSIPSWSFKTLLRSQPSLSTKMLEEVCRRLRTSEASLNY
jgi:CRP/FNR family cyclic AMP-dependent transcriptional regulator